MKKQFLILSLVAAMLTCGFTGCGENPVETTMAETTENMETETETDPSYWETSDELGDITFDMISQ